MYDDDEKLVKFQELFCDCEEVFKLFSFIGFEGLKLIEVEFN